LTIKKLSLGDALSYLLTTAENELGVVVATSEAGKLMNLLSTGVTLLKICILPNIREVDICNRVWQHYVEFRFPSAADVVYG